MKKSIIVIFALLTSGIFFSCATNSAFVENVQNYEEEKIECKTPFVKILDNNKRTYNWNSASLEMGKVSTKESGYWIFVLGKATSYISTTGKFSIGGKTEFDSAIFIKSTDKQNLLETGWFFGDIKRNNVEVNFVTGKGKNILTLNGNSDILIEENDSFVPVKVSRIKKVMQGDKQWNTIGGSTSGFLIQISNEDYAVIDVFSAPKLLINKQYSHTLSEDEKAFADSLILLLWDYYNTFEKEGTEAGSRKIITN